MKMQVSITTRHFETDEKIKEYLLEKVQKLEKFFSQVISARAIMTKEGYRHIVEIALNAHNMQLVAKEESEDMHSAVDLAVAKLHNQLTRFKDKVKEHKARRVSEKEKQAKIKQLSEEI